MSNKVRNISKILFLMMVVTISLLLGMPKSEAASFSITSGISSITVGNSYTISISAKGLTGKFNISHSSNVSVNVSSVWVENGSADTTIKVTTKKEGEAIVTLTPETVADSEGNDVTLSAKTDKVTVKAKSSSGESSEGSSTSGSENSSGNSSSNEATKPQEPSFTTVNETVYATDSVNVRSSYSTSSSVIGSLNKGDSVTRIGKGSNGWSKVKYNNKTAYISSSYLTTEKPEESNEKNLKSLTIDGDFELTPKFDKDVTEYSLSVDNSVETLKIDAKAVDDNAKVEITGNDKLLEGENTIEIKVTAEDGTVRTYKINVTKGKEILSADFGLSELSVSGYTLTPNFSTNVYEYKLDIEDETVTSLNVNANSTVKGAVVDIAGNNDLKLGENIITILVKSEDGKEVVTYQIVVNIIKESQENNQIIAGIDNKDLYMYVGIGLGVVIVIVIVVVIIVKHRNNMENDEDDYDYYNGFNPLNNDFMNKIDNDVQNEININDTNNNLEIAKKEDKIDENNVKTETNKKRKSVIEENFGADISYDDCDDEKPRRKRGKHF